MRGINRSPAASLAMLIVASYPVASLCGAQQANWGKTITVEIRAPDHKPDGKTWDLEVPVMFGAVMPNIGDPAPDMMLCVVDASGAENCIHEARVNQAGVPYSVCPNSYVCNFSNVKVPSSGYFGLLIMDLDPFPNKQDYMLAAVFRNGGPEDARKGWEIEKALRTLIHKWNGVGAPDEFPAALVDDCTPKNPCFGDSRGGIPSIAIGALEVRTCGMPISGDLDFGPGNGPGAVAFAYQMRENECPGTLEFVWQFGDGTSETTSGPQAAHRYGRAGAYTTRVVPRCVRKTSVCEAASKSTTVSVGR